MGQAWTGVPALLVAFLLCLPSAFAQTTAVCSNTPAPDERIECIEDATSTGDVDIDAEGVDIDTSISIRDGIFR